MARENSGRVWKSTTLTLSSAAVHGSTEKGHRLLHKALIAQAQVPESSCSLERYIFEFFIPLIENRDLVAPKILI